MAEKVKGGPKQPPKHLLYIQTSRERRLPLKQMHWNRIEQSITESITKAFFEGSSYAIDWSSYSKDRGLIACVDMATLTWIQTLISSITIDGVRFRGWMRNEYGDKTLFSAYFEERYAVVGGPKLLQMIKRVARFNGQIDLAEWYRIKPHGYRLKILADKKASEEIIRRGPIQLPTGSKVRFQRAGHQTPTPVTISNEGASASSMGKHVEPPAQQ